MEKLKKCFRCGNSFPRTPEFFYSAGRGKLDKVCKECKKEWNKEYYKDHERPVTKEKYVRNFVIRYAKKWRVWTVYYKDPWQRLEEFITLEEALKWVEDK